MSGTAEGATSVNQETFRKAMARLSAAVNIVTTDGAAGRHGITASAVCSVTDAPPMLLVCINRRSGLHMMFRQNGVLCVNVLGGRHQMLSQRFSTPAEFATRFDHEAWRHLATGAPALADANASLDCRIHQVTDIGTHSVYFCEVVDVALADQADGLVYFNRSYHVLY
jgi:flavin reductase